MSNLRKIYSGSFKDRPRFDDGGYVSYVSADPSAQYMTGDNSGAPSAADISGLTQDAATMPTGGQLPVTSDVGTVMNGGLIPGSENGSGGYTGSSSSSGLSGALGKILGSLGLGGGNTSNQSALGALAGLLSAAGNYKQNQSKSQLPAMPSAPGFGTSSASGLSGYGPPGGYNFKNYLGANASTPGTGYAPRSQAPSTASYYTYGSGPEQQSFRPVQMAAGGAVPDFGMGGLMAAPGQTPMTPRPAGARRPVKMMPTGMAEGGALSGVSRHVTGPGDGTSDSIPARLANGEYVIDAQAVSMLGNGDNSAGAKRLDEFRKSLRQHKGGALSKGQMAPDAKPIHKYMGGGQ